MTGQCTAKVDKFVRYFKFLAVDYDGWFSVWCCRGLLKKHFGLLCAYCMSEVITGFGELIHAPLHVRLSAEM